MIKIIFIGLIAHVTLNTNHMAVLVWHPAHTAEIVVPKDYDEVVPGAKQFLLSYVDGNGAKHFSLTGHRIQILGTAVGKETEITNDFDTKVVHLQKDKQYVTDGTYVARDVSD